MLAPILPLALAAALLQSEPPEASLIRATPADTDVVVRVRGIEAARDDLVAMIKATSPALGAQAGPALEQAVASFSEMFGAEAVKTPFLGLIRVAPPEQPGQNPWAVIVPTDNPEGVLKALNAGKAPAIETKDGVGSFAGQRGDTVYTASGSGFVVFGLDEPLVRSVQARGEKPALDKVLTGALGESFHRGDVGLYVNLARLHDRYKEQIAQAKEQFFAALDQAGQQAGNAEMMGFVKNMYGGLFDATKYGDALTLSLDFDADRLAIDSVVAFKPESEPAKVLAGAQPGSSEALGKLPADAAYYVHMNLDPSLAARLQAMSLSMVAPGQKPSPEFEAAIQAQKGQGRIATTGAMSFGEKGMTNLTVVEVADPKAYLDASAKMLQAFKSKDDAGLMGIIKDVKVTPKAETHKGFTFDRVEMVFDLEKLGQAQPNNPAAASLRSMFGGDASNTWMGTDGKIGVTLNAPSWEAARDLLDTYLSGTDTVGALPGFQAVRSKLAEKPTVIGLFSAQGLLAQITFQLRTMLGAPDLKPPGDLPKEPVFVGASVVPVANGLHVQAVIPTAVGPVFEKGLVPIITRMQGRVDQ